MTVRTRDYAGPRSLDPACAPDDVDTQMTCECLTCGHEWLQRDTPGRCPNCGEDDMDGIEYAEVPV